ncbi:hypothetical protein BN2476_20095 [Paraburkholderia piptadeniae]|uniref:Uncharacterized protein n=1 Tax=Paraburkholderia piptadeniae TaxID=1701573 RepID=A0A1N7RJI1_9BURK|nr:hypothetical protein BN2476_20095 [Paraburkholderia piptadeniae]
MTVTAARGERCSLFCQAAANSTSHHASSYLRDYPGDVRIPPCSVSASAFARFGASRRSIRRMSETHAAHDKLSIVLARALLPNRSNWTGPTHHAWPADCSEEEEFHAERFASPLEVAGRRHDDLHGHRSTGRRTQCAEPVARRAEFRARRSAGRWRDQGDARGSQPVRTDGRHRRTTRGAFGKSGNAVRRALRSVHGSDRDRKRERRAVLDDQRARASRR